MKSVISRNAVTSSYDLVGPSINGVVNVPLIELDQMRVNHSQAVDFAKQLEENMGKVIVIVRERKDAIPRKTSFGDFYLGGGEHEISRKYVNMEEVVEAIRKEQGTKVEDEFRGKVESYLKDIKDLKKIIQIKDETVAIAMDNCNRAEKIIQLKEEEIRLLKIKKGFWYSFWYYITH